jgi:hypothetical protein
MGWGTTTSPAEEAEHAGEAQHRQAAAHARARNARDRSLLHGRVEGAKKRLRRERAIVSLCGDERLPSGRGGFACACVTAVHLAA